jgi:hypothetical protein
MSAVDFVYMFLGGATLLLIAGYLFQRWTEKQELRAFKMKILAPEIERAREELKKLKEAKIRGSKSYEEALEQYNRKYRPNRNDPGKGGPSSGS